jgi:hypothetical protein
MTGIAAGNHPVYLRSGSGETMNGKTTQARRGIRRNLWVNAGVVLLLLFATLLGVTQALILLTIYALVIVPS